MKDAHPCVRDRRLCSVDLMEENEHPSNIKMLFLSNI
jgi:hypothetical protein